jgi:hypothetical protein
MQRPPEADLEKIQPEIQSTAARGPMALNLALLVWYWGNWPAITAIVIMSVALALMNMKFVEGCARRYRRQTAEWFRMLGNGYKRTAEDSYEGFPHRPA